MKAVIAESFERIHRSNLVAMGVLPLEFAPGEGAKALGLKGDEVFSISGMDGLKPGATLEATAKSEGEEVKFKLKARIDNKAEMDYFESGGVLPYVLQPTRRLTRALRHALSSRTASRTPIERVSKFLNNSRIMLFLGPLECILDLS